MKKLITVLLLLFTAMAFQAQQALQQYYTAVQALESQSDSRKKSEERGKALAVFYDERKSEAGMETAKSETAQLLRQYIDYDFQAAYGFAMKVKDVGDAKMFIKNYMSNDEQKLIRTMAAHVAANANTTTSPPYPANIPPPGKGLKDSWQNSGIATALKDPKSNLAAANSSAATQTPDNGKTEFQNAIAAYQTKNYTKALNGFKKAAEKGNIDAMYNLGVLYYNGEGIAKNETEAFYWFKKAAEKGHNDAKHDVGVMYAYGKGMPVPLYEEALKWFKQSADKGNINSMIEMAIVYVKLVQNEEAFNWYKKAADKGDARGMYMLGVMYRSGEGATQNTNEAKKWFQQAADKGFEKAKTALQQLQTQHPQNLTAFKDANGKWGFKDDKNKIIVQPKYDKTKPFAEGMAAVGITEEGAEKWGYIDQNGKEIIPLIYGDAIRFSEGLAAVRPVGKTWDAYYGFIDKSGKLVIPHEYPFVFDTKMYDGWVFTDGKAKVYKDKRIFYIDKTGKEVKDGTAAAQAQELKAFSDKPFDRFGKWGFKDQNGKIIVAPKYNSFHPFREGLAAVSIGGSYDEEFDVVLGSRYGFIDNTGKEVIALKYESINDGFYEGLAAVKLNGKWGYINTAGKEVIPFQYSEAFIFIKGKAKVNKDGRTFYIDKNGKEIQ